MKYVSCAAAVLLILFLLAGTAPVSMSAAALTATPEPTEESAGEVRIQFLGRASFLIVAPDGMRVVIAPYTDMPYSFPEDIEADVVLCSHTHHDHMAFYLIAGLPAVVTIYEVPSAERFGITEVTGYLSVHGDYGSESPEENMVFVIQMGDIKLVHLGDFGSFEDEALYAELNDADVVFVPGGDAAGPPLEEIMPLMERIHARTIVPMHWVVPAEHVSGGAPLESFLAILPDEVSVTEVDELLVQPGMPEQVVVIHEMQSEE